MADSNLLVVFAVVIFVVIGSQDAVGQRTNRNARFSGWKTDTTQHSIPLGDLFSGGVGKDGIPSIDTPHYTTATKASEWIGPNEPVIAVEIAGISRAYPLQILIWHEIVNETLNGRDILVTFCPLCYSAIVFDREINGEVLRFGVSGFLRHSDMIMYDRSTESLWQQFSGEAVVGTLTGTQLGVIPAQIISFRRFREDYPAGDVLNRPPGSRRNYGTNPYVGYDDVRTKPFLYQGPEDNRLRPMEKVIGLQVNGLFKAYPYSETLKKEVINDVVAGVPIVVFHREGTATALGRAVISDAEDAGSTGVYSRSIGKTDVQFEKKDGQIIDIETGSEWSVTGLAVSGPMAGTRLTRLQHGDYFAFAWLVFHPDTQIYGR